VPEWNNLQQSRLPLGLSGSNRLPAVAGSRWAGVVAVSAPRRRQLLIDAREVFFVIKKLKNSLLFSPFPAS